MSDNAALREPADVSDEPPPNRIYAEKHRSTILFLARRGMSRRHIEAIYGRTATNQVLGVPE